MLTSGFVRNDLWKRAQQRAGKSGFTFTDDCEYHVKQFIEAAVNNSSVDLSTFSDDTAVQNFNKFIDEMVNEAGRQGYNRLHEDTFHYAKASLCPLWPIC